jgi:hypothetical protein
MSRIDIYDDWRVEIFRSLIGFLWLETCYGGKEM